MTRGFWIIVLLIGSTVSAAVQVRTDSARTTVSWPVDGGDARLVLRHDEPDRPLIAEIATPLTSLPSDPNQALLRSDAQLRAS